MQKLYIRVIAKLNYIIHQIELKDILKSKIKAKLNSLAK